KGRLKEQINRGGEKISPREVDEVLLGFPDVVEALCFAIPDESLGEEVAAAVVLREGARTTSAELQSFASEHLAQFKVPKRILFLNDLPRGSTGKLQRIGLAAHLAMDSKNDRIENAVGEYVAPRTDLEKQLA